MSDPIVFTCSHGAHYTAFELEMGMSWATAAYLNEQEERRYNLDADRVHEERMAREHVAGESDVPWPWYAEAPNIEIEREMVE